MKKFRVLIVDDEEDLREIFRDGLEANGFEVFEASSGNEAIQFIKSHSVEGVISDIRMPDGSGLEFLEYIQNLSTEELLVFLMTGFSDITPEEAYDRGAAALFKKPVDPDIVIKSIQNIERLKRGQHQIRPPRYENRFDISLAFNSNSSENQNRFQTKTRNISRRGFLCEKPELKADAGDQVLFQIRYRTDQERKIEGKAEIKRMIETNSYDPQALMACEIIELTKASEENLKTLLGLLEDKVIPVH